MPNQRSRRKKTQKFYCPYCQRRLWRVGSPKYFLFYQSRSEIQQGFNLTAKKASFLINQNPVWVDRQVWLEEFFCEEHGKIWMHLSKSKEGFLKSRLAKREDWQRTTRTPDPERSHCSVSEFTYRISRRSQMGLAKRIYE